MAKATITLANGTSVVIEGTPDEVRRLLEIYGGESSPPAKKGAGRDRKRSGKETAARAKAGTEAEEPDLSEIINLVKTCDEAEAIEEHILDRTSMVDRTLLPLYIVHEHLRNAYGLTSGDVNRVTSDLGIPIRTSNASTTLSKTAARYVIGDKVRKKGIPVRYKLSRRGIQYMKSVVSGKANAE